MLYEQTEEPDHMHPSIGHHLEHGHTVVVEDVPKKWVQWKLYSKFEE